jgi:dolichol-phosphate mannosyltransferase
MKAADCFVSVVAPLRNDADVLEPFLNELTGVLRHHYENYEVVLVDDGSTDRTAAVLEDVLSKFEYLRVIRLTRSFGQEMAISAGLDSVIGDYVVVMLPDSDPPGVIPEMVDTARRRGGTVLGIVESKKRSLAERVGTRLFYAYANRVLKLGFPENSTQFRVMSREAVNAVTRIKDRLRFLRSFTVYVGYSNEEFSYQPISRRGTAPRRRGLLESLALAISLIVANSTHPLRLVSVLGLGVSGINAVGVVYVLVIYAFRSERLAAGWASQTLQNSVMFFFLFLVLAVACEYLGRILEETWNRPLYLVLEERNSSKEILDAGRRNVVNRSSEGAGAGK